MTIPDLQQYALTPMWTLLPPAMCSVDAEALVITIALQESRVVYRRQIPTGPARGYWQFEQDGAVAGVMTHPQTRTHAEQVVRRFDLSWERRAIWTALEHHDLLAACFARLNLWWDPRELPGRRDPPRAWQIYLHTWRPGKPHQETWGWCWDQAWRAVARESTARAHLGRISAGSPPLPTD